MRSSLGIIDLGKREVRSHKKMAFALKMPIQSKSRAIRVYETILMKLIGYDCLWY